MNAVALFRAAPLDAWFQAMRCWLLTLLASFLDALEWARCPLPDDGRWRMRVRAAVRMLLAQMRESIAEAERDVARALLVAALARVIGRRRASGARPVSIVNFDQATPRHRVEARLLRPVLKDWRRHRGRAASRLAARVRALAATLADPARAVGRIVDRLIRLRRDPTWRTSTRRSQPSSPLSFEAGAAVVVADTS